MMVIRYLQIAIVIGILTGVWAYGYYKYSTGVSDTELRLENEYLKRLAIVESANVELINKQNKLEDQYFEGLLDAHENTDRYISDIRTNTKRLYITTKERCVSSNESNSSVPVAEGRSEVPKDVAERLIRRRAEADSVVLKLNACIDYVKGNYAHVNSKK